MQTILIVDDHPLFRAAIRDITHRLFAAKGWEVSYREAASIEEAIAVASAMPDLDLITLDICMPGTSDLSGLLRFRSEFPAAPIVVVSAIVDRDTVHRALLCGALGFIPRASPADVMTEALEKILAGGVYLPQEVAVTPLPLACAGGIGGQELMPPLTPRQAAVLAKLVEGKSNKQIARELAISDMTVKVHVTAILRSLGVVTRAQAIVAVRGER